jgi:hypothetical protein
VAVATHFLDSVHRDIGAADERMDIVAIVRVGADTDAGSQAAVMLIDTDR